MITRNNNSEKLGKVSVIRQKSKEKALFFESNYSTISQRLVGWIDTYNSQVPKEQEEQKIKGNCLATAHAVMFLYWLNNSGTADKERTLADTTFRTSYKELTYNLGLSTSTIKRHLLHLQLAGLLTSFYILKTYSLPANLQIRMAPLAVDLVKKGVAL